MREEVREGLGRRFGAGGGARGGPPGRFGAVVACPGGWEEDFGAMGSKQVEQELARSGALVTAAEAHEERVGAGLARLARETKAKAPAEAALRGVVHFVQQVLEARAEALRGSERALDAELGDDAKPLQEREEAAGEVAALLVSLRGALGESSGDAAVRAAGFVGNTPDARDPSGVAELAARVLENLRKHPPRGKSKHLRLDLAGALGELEEPLARLRKGVADVAREKREEQAARATRDAAWSAHEGAVRGAGLVLEGLLRLAGEEDLADRLRVTARSPEGASADPPSGGDGGAPKSA